MLRTALLPGLVGAVAYNWSHRNHGVALFEIGHVFRRPTDPSAELPDERERARRGAGRSRRRRGRAPVASGGRGARGRRAPASRTASCRACTPPVAAGVIVGDVDGRARSARSTPRCSRPTASGSGSRTSRSTSTRCWRCPTASTPTGPSACTRARTSTSPSRSTTPCPPRRWRTPSARAGGELLWSVRPVRRLPRRGRGRRPPQPRLPPAPPGERPHPHRRRRRTVRQQVIDAVQSALPATLWG